MADDARDEARGAAADEAAQDCDDGDAARQQATSVLPSPSASSSASSASASLEPRVEGNGGSYGVFRGDSKLGSFWQPRAEHTQAALYMFSCMHMLLEFVLCICYELVLPITYGQYVQRPGECVWLFNAQSYAHTFFYYNLNTTLQVGCRLHGCKKFVKTAQLAMSPLAADRLVVEWLSKR